MAVIVDRRGQKPRGLYDSITKFKNKFKNAIKRKIDDFLEHSDIEDIKSDQIVDLSDFDIDESKHSIAHGRDNFNKVFIGNTKYRKGDTIPKQSQQQEQPGNGVGEDDFYFIMTADEFQKFLFDGLSLPDLTKAGKKTIKEKTFEHKGFVNDGLPNNLSVVRSFKQSLARKIAMEAYLDEEIASTTDPVKIADLEEQKQNIPMFEDIDLRFKTYPSSEKYTTSAVMYCVMDVSGSMGQKDKDIAKRFFMLLYLFLSNVYQDNVELVFLRYHETADICDQDTFFYSRETGGTSISNAFEVLVKDINSHYDPTIDNIYVCHIADGDLGYNEDVDKVTGMLINQVLPLINHYFYVQTRAPSFFSEAAYIDALEVIEKTQPKVDSGFCIEPTSVYKQFKRMFSHD